LAALDLIPLFSWLSLHGKCRYCHKPIKDSPLVELSLPALFVMSYIWWPLPLRGAGLLQFVFWLLFLIGYTILAVYDLRWRLLPDKVVYPLTGLAGLQVFTLTLFYGAGATSILSALAGALIISGSFYILFQISGGRWIGGGDVKLGLVLGLLAGGAWQALSLLFIASLSGSLVSIPLLAGGRVKPKATIPFGPFLLLASVVIQLFGKSILHWYTHLVV
jgi:prepilin signal peptidase PulO-like enzyme (type II secretory pathway)